ncbi:hypothetical protein [Nostoc sp.]|uniref:hypothetical protein n=1 Tax=Nostoc sp. TaxID=1180 RepID=UPI002FFD192B
MIDDIKISSGIINNPQMQVEFNTNTQSTYLNSDGGLDVSLFRRQCFDYAQQPRRSNPRTTA